MARSTSQFQTIRSEGALLPPDVLQAIASEKVDGAGPSSYHLPPGTKVREAAAHSWSVLKKYWKAFQDIRCRLPEDETGTEATNQNWLLPLFEELKYGRLATTKAPQIDGRTYPIERFYSQVPIHFIGCNLPLDRRTKGARGAATASPHSMMQEFLNRSGESVWGLFSNGLVLRIVRDNVSLSRQAYVEFDLEAMMDGDVYSDFVLLWMLCHQSRVEGDKPQEFWLEKWSQLAREQGTRVLSDLRKGVARAIEALGRGFLAHPHNDWLRQQLQDGHLDKQEYYRQVLRIVYRLLFLFVAEDRGLLHAPDADPAACDLYDTHYSTRRLRDLADQIRGSKHADLWHSLTLVFDALGRLQGCPQLGLSALGSFLWRRSSTGALLGPAHKGAEPVEHPVFITNDDLLSAVHALAFVEQDKARRSVDYRNLGSEELGSVYESLLELHPAVNIPARTFELNIAAGHERKTTGSYYTPDSLVQCLLDSALEPVVAERIKGKKADEAAKAILGIKVCDPACGSGHFLIAAAHRLARHLARVRSGETEPSPADHQHGLRDVISHCIFGVDINPMAVELCKVSLWMEALEPGKPLSFLDHHVQCGNSLLGATPALLKQGVPDEAFEPIEGDDKKLCKEYKKQNRDERSGQRTLFADGGKPWERMGDMAVAMATFDTTDDDSLDSVRNKEERYARLVGSADYLSGRFWADAWCAAFVWKKTKEFDYAITEDVFRSIERNPRDCTPWMRAEIQRLAHQYQFFHWHLSFPQVFRVPPPDEQSENVQWGCSGGFDVVLGNPPWVRQEHLGPIKNLLSTWPAFSSTADLSVFFVNLSLDIVQPGGRLGLLTPNKWLRNRYGEALRTDVRKRSSIHLIVDFGHSRTLFPDADTFPAACVLSRSQTELADTANLTYLYAPDERREPLGLPALLKAETSQVPYGQLQPSGWQFSSPAEEQLVKKLFTSGTPLGEVLPSPIRRGVTTGLNDAFVVDLAVRDGLISACPAVGQIIHPWVRGADIKRWAAIESGQYLIFTRRGINISQYPCIEHHLQKWQPALTPKSKSTDDGPGRKPGPYKWYEIQDNTAYFLDFEQPKILVPSILYYCEFAFVADVAYPSNKVNVIPSDDLALLGILNSRTMWWLANRHFGKMKDNALSVDVAVLGQLPIPKLSVTYRSAIADCARTLTKLHEATPHGEEVVLNETVLDLLVAHAFGLSMQERHLIAETLPPRDPIVVAGQAITPDVMVRLAEEGELRAQSIVRGLGTATQVEMAQAHWPSHVHAPKETVLPVPEEVAVAEFAAMAYPSGNADKAICAAALAVVEQSGGLSSMEHLDSLLLATHPDWCKAFLDNRGQSPFDAARRSAPDALFVKQGQSIRWKECRDYLEQLNAVTVAHSVKNQPIGAGTALTSAKAGLPTGVDGVVKYVLMALARIRELRRDPATVLHAQRLILDAFEEQHRLCGLAA